MAAMKNSGATRRGAGKSQRGLHRFGPEIWEKFRGVRPARPVGMRPSGLGSGKSPSSTCHCARWQDAPAAEEVQGVVRRPGHTGIVRLPAGMSFEAGGLEHPDHLIVEMARVQGTVLRLTLANSSAISRVRRPISKGLWRPPWRCHRSGSCFGRPSAQVGPPGRAALSGTKYSTWGGGYTRKREAGAGSEMEGR